MRKTMQEKSRQRWNWYEWESLNYLKNHENLIIKVSSSLAMMTFSIFFSTKSLQTRISYVDRRAVAARGRHPFEFKHREERKEEIWKCSFSSPWAMKINRENDVDIDEQIEDEKSEVNGRRETKTTSILLFYDIEFSTLKSLFASSLRALLLASCFFLVVSCDL